MSAKSPDDSLELQAYAFEYVAGTLRGPEREKFKQRLNSSTQLQTEVIFWEEHFMTMPVPEPLLPKETVWPSIEQRLATIGANKTAQKPTRNWLYWLAPSLVGSLLMAFIYVLTPAPVPANQYVAVLTDAQGHAALTALTQGQESIMQIHWQDVKIPAGKTLQLWAISSRDQQARSLSVLADARQKNLNLNTAQLRLVKDASHLVLTEEEIGGSAMDEPSEVIVAKGICVRLEQNKT